MSRLQSQPPEWIDAAPTQVVAEIDVAASPERVWGVIADHERWPEWFTALTRVEVTSGATGVGGGRRVYAGGFELRGRRFGEISFDETFTVWAPAECFAFAVTEVSTPIPVFAAMAESVTIEPTETGCRVVYRQGLQGRTATAWMVTALGKRMKQQLEAGLAGLRDVAESSA